MVLLARYPKGSEGRGHVIAGTCMNPRTLGDDDMRERAFAALRDRVSGQTPRIVRRMHGQEPRRR